MGLSSRAASPRTKYHPDAYKFVFAALNSVQEDLHRFPSDDPDDETAHVTGPELLEGARRLAVRQYGLLARTVLRQWGIKSTDDFGHIVFELIERGEMRKTDRDQLSDFFDVYDFDEAFDRSYKIVTRHAFE